jgi:hypothetical protein
MEGLHAHRCVDFLSLELTGLAKPDVVTLNISPGLF